MARKQGIFPAADRLHSGETMHCANSGNPLETTLRGCRERSGAKRHEPCEVEYGKGVTSQNVTVQPGFDLPCPTAVDQSRQQTTAAPVTPGPPVSRWCRWHSRRNGQGGTTSSPRGPPRPLSPNCSPPPSRPRKPAACGGPRPPMRRPLTAPAGIRSALPASGPGKSSERELARPVRRRVRTIARLQAGGRHFRRGRGRRDLGLHDFRLDAIHRRGFDGSRRHGSDRRRHRFDP